MLSNRSRMRLGLRDGQFPAVFRRSMVLSMVRKSGQVSLWILGMLMRRPRSSRSWLKTALRNCSVRIEKNWVGWSLGSRCYFGFGCSSKFWVRSRKWYFSQYRLGILLYNMVTAWCRSSDPDEELLLGLFHPWHWSFCKVVWNVDSKKDYARLTTAYSRSSRNCCLC